MTLIKRCLIYLKRMKHLHNVHKNTDIFIMMNNIQKILIKCNTYFIICILKCNK